MRGVQSDAERGHVRRRRLQLRRDVREEAPDGQPEALLEGAEGLRRGAEGRRPGQLPGLPLVYPAAARVAEQLDDDGRGHPPDGLDVLPGHGAERGHPVRVAAHGVVLRTDQQPPADTR